MPSFGRRGIVPHRPLFPPSALSGDAPSSARPPPTTWLGLKLATFLGLTLILLGFQIQHEAPRTVRADYAPGARYDFGLPYVAQGCPQRRWTVGDYVPQACVQGQGLHDVTAIGLQNTDNDGRHDLRTMVWIRTSSDVLLVDWPTFSKSCRVWQVVQDRFASPSAQADAADHAKPPLSYILGTAFRFGYALFYPLTAIGLLAVWAWRRIGWAPQA